MDLIAERDDGGQALVFGAQLLGFFDQIVGPGKLLTGSVFEEEGGPARLDGEERVLGLAEVDAGEADLGVSMLRADLKRATQEGLMLALRGDVIAMDAEVGVDRLVSKGLVALESLTQIDGKVEGGAYQSAEGVHALHVTQIPACLHSARDDPGRQIFLVSEVAGEARGGFKGGVEVGEGVAALDMVALQGVEVVFAALDDALDGPLGGLLEVLAQRREEGVVGYGGQLLEEGAEGVPGLQRIAMVGERAGAQALELLNLLSKEALWEGVEDAEVLCGLDLLGDRLEVGAPLLDEKEHPVEAAGALLRVVAVQCGEGQMMEDPLGEVVGVASLERLGQRLGVALGEGVHGIGEGGMVEEGDEEIEVGVGGGGGEVEGADEARQEVLRVEGVEEPLVERGEHLRYVATRL